MKTSAAAIIFLLSSSSAFAQQQAPPAQVKMDCRELSGPSDSLLPSETLVNGMACHVVGAKATPVQSASLTNSAATPVPASPASAQPALPVRTEAPAAIVATPVSMNIVSGSTIFITPMNGFENYLAAALQKKHVPLVPVASEEQAAYVLKGTSEEKKAGWAKMAFTGQIHSDDAASVQLIDRKTGAIVFAYAVNKKNTVHGEQTTAEACAKHLKEQIGKK